jgi:predicted nucleic acid-binding protein
MQRLLFDSSVYVSALRSEALALRVEALAAGATLWLSAVVLEELYAGARERDRTVVESLARHFERAGKILVPQLNDWMETGKVLARLAAKYHYEKIGRGRLTNDALIAMSAARVGITVVTANARDFHRLAEFRDFQWQLAAV